MSKVTENKAHILRSPYLCVNLSLTGCASCWDVKGERLQRTSSHLEKPIPMCESISDIGCASCLDVRGERLQRTKLTS